MPGFCKSATIDKIAAHLEDEDEPIEEKMERLTKKLEEQFTESAILAATIRANLRRLGR